MRKQISLIALVPNQHIRLKLQQLRRDLFRDSGFASALAFEPIIPLTSVPRIPEKNKVIQLLTPPPAETVRVPPISVTGIAQASNHFFLRIDRPELIEELREKLSVLSLLSVPGELSEAEACPLPLYPGVFIAQRNIVSETAGEPGATGKSSKPELPEAGLTWNSNRIGLYELSFDEEEGAWWDGLEWSMVWQFPFRKWEKKKGTV